MATTKAIVIPAMERKLDFCNDNEDIEQAGQTP